MGKNYMVGYTIKANRTETGYFRFVKAKNRAEAMKLVKQQVKESTGRNAFRPYVKQPTWMELLNEMDHRHIPFSRKMVETCMMIEFDHKRTGVMPRWEDPATELGMKELDAAEPEDMFGRRLK